MKKIWKYLGGLLIICMSECTFSQTLEHTYYFYSKQFYVTDIGNNDYKYVITDTSGFSIYNLDHSLYLNVITPVQLFTLPSGYEIAYITKSLFDCDTSNLEYVITAPSYAGNFYIYRTDGTLLFEKDTVSGPYCFGCQGGSTLVQPIANTPNGAKLFLFNRQPVDSLYVYALCGNLPDMVGNIPLDNGYVQIYPNPTNGIINFNINLPNNRDEFKLTIYDESFRAIDEKTIYGNYQFNTNNRSLSSGTYLFDLRTQNKVYQTGKFILSK